MSDYPTRIPLATLEINGNAAEVFSTRDKDGRQIFGFTWLADKTEDFIYFNEGSWVAYTLIKKKKDLEMMINAIEELIKTN